jgi:hypothetical protein
VAASAVRTPDELPASLRAMLDHNGPYLLEISLGG